MQAYCAGSTFQRVRVGLQCKFMGKAQEMCTTLIVAQSLDPDVVKATVLLAYELVLEAYR